MLDAAGSSAENSTESPVTTVVPGTFEKKIGTTCGHFDETECTVAKSNHHEKRYKFAESGF